jgi:hypothetical protein
MEEERKLTSVKIDKQLFEDFQINLIKYKYSFTKLAEKSIFLYNTDPEYRKLIHTTKITK